MASEDRVREIRNAIAALDERLASALEERAKLSREIRSLAEAGTPVEPERDASAVVDRAAPGELPKDALRSIFAQIQSTARSIERPLRVAYLGPQGNFCYQMAKLHFGAAATLVECGTIADALEEVQRQRAAFCTFPFDSSVDGLSLPAVSALAETDLSIVAERTLPARLCLMNATGSGETVERVLGTTLAHASSEQFRKREYPNATVVDLRSSVEAVNAAKADPKSAAVVPEATGREVGLEVVKENVSNEPDLRYRHAIVGSRPASRSGNDTTCLLFSLDDAPGTLFQVLRHFAERGINLKKIQSRPVRGASWDYVFYVEVAGHGSDRGVVTALEAVKGSTKYLKLLGSFPTEA
ncbi:MAG TPA: prephenate dehydratase domain-containing protein [Polyangiaceae bacterium]|nr:prephenate dehydratase domain-containing protein [Polyangiaceae bacterium]